MTLLKSNFVATGAITKKGRHLALCTQCGDIHYKGFWYASDSQFAQSIDRQRDLLTDHLCPACEMQNAGAYAGVLQIDQIPDDMLGPVFSVVTEAVEQDTEGNPQHRILGVSVTRNCYTLKSTSSSMVRRIKRKLLDTYKMCEAKSTYTMEPQPILKTTIMFMDFRYSGRYETR